MREAPFGGRTAIWRARRMRAGVQKPLALRAWPAENLRLGSWPARAVAAVSDVAIAKPATRRIANLAPLGWVAILIEGPMVISNAIHNPGPDQSELAGNCKGFGRGFEPQPRQKGALGRGYPADSALTIATDGAFPRAEIGSDVGSASRRRS